METFVDLNMGLDLTAVPDLKTVPEGLYNLRVESVESKVSQNGNPYIALRFSFLDDPEAQDVYNNLMLPTADNDQRTTLQKKRRIKKFVEEFSVPFTASGINFENAIGCTGFALLIEEDTEDFGKQNRIRRFGRA
ncbi:DUF669 domain-containing protein [Patescibacteria group bacterium]|uniref:DUF669 domain-containing protein n=1 Tax=viral metagenome TaxID=1070528 RepID=A0A6M3KQD0_9ZZZZ|nr:DUF669 domain-containing protein [Patescibacteria group bacterium]